MITITNTTILDYLVSKIIKGKRDTPKYIQINNGLKIVWKNNHITTKNVSVYTRISEKTIVVSLCDYHGDEIARITYIIDKII